MTRAEEEYSTVDECIRIMKEWMREMDEARERLIKQRTTPEPNVPVIDMREWQRIAAEKPPERLDFDE